ncbi:hypothetical protein RV10_GL001214 [Enterococcus pallens]|nr:hypothetical protein RV10_GL001214 [Enterococcus pallens]
MLKTKGKKMMKRKKHARSQKKIKNYFQSFFVGASKDTAL